MEELLRLSRRWLYLSHSRFLFTTSRCNDESILIDFAVNSPPACEYEALESGKSFIEEVTEL